MKKRIAFLVVFILLISTVFAGCNASNEGSNDASATNQSQNVTLHDGNHTYDVDGVELTLKTDIDKYIKGNVFYFCDLWHDLGWQAKEPSYEYNPDYLGCYYYGPEGESFVAFDGNVGQWKAEDVYWHAISGVTSGHKVRFARYDDGDYKVNEGGVWKVNYEQIVVLVFVMERLMDDQSVSPFNNVSLPNSTGIWVVNK